MENKRKLDEIKEQAQRSVKISLETVKRITAARKTCRITQLELSNRSSISIRTIRDLERGRRRSFTEATLIHLCRALKIELDDVLGNEVVLDRKAKKVNLRWWEICSYLWYLCNLNVLR